MNFIKYSVNGNDFILIDLRVEKIAVDRELVTKICSRRTGVGADGVLTVNFSTKYDAEMRIYNADGSSANMCGNGVRAVMDYLDKDIVTVDTLAGIQRGRVDFVLGPSVLLNYVEKMKEIHEFDMVGYQVDTGVPHFVFKVMDIEKVDLIKIGEKLVGKYDVNVNFFTIIDDDEILMKTYERGVGETLSCGTGTVAVGIVLKHKFNSYGIINVNKNQHGPKLKIEDNIYLCGKVDKIFSGRFLDV